MLGHDLYIAHATPADGVLDLEPQVRQDEVVIDDGEPMHPGEGLTVLRDRGVRVPVATTLEEPLVVALGRRQAGLVNRHPVAPATAIPRERAGRVKGATTGAGADHGAASSASEPLTRPSAPAQ